MAWDEIGTEIKGEWCYLYRPIDQEGHTLAFNFLSL
ncbi:DDE-type integrase/transposase/recombinase [Bacillus sp. FSL K6-0268]